MKTTTWLSIFLSVLLLSVCTLFTGCSTASQIKSINTTETITETVTETEYQPTFLDLTEIVLLAVSQRPDNSQYKVITGENLKTTWDLMHNSWNYQCAWEDWQAYAESLEEVLLQIRSVCADPSVELEPILPAQHGSESESLGNWVTVELN